MGIKKRVKKILKKIEKKRGYYYNIKKKDRTKVAIRKVDDRDYELVYFVKYKRVGFQEDYVEELNDFSKKEVKEVIESIMEE